MNDESSGEKEILEKNCDPWNRTYLNRTTFQTMNFSEL
jgi:hypothetical protein